MKADVVDDFCELAYFRTRIAVRNTQQNVRQSLIPGEEEQGGETAVVVDTFLISILSPHLYVQSTAIEQGRCMVQSSLIPRLSVGPPRAWV